MFSGDLLQKRKRIEKLKDNARVAREDQRAQGQNQPESKEEENTKGETHVEMSEKSEKIGKREGKHKPIEPIGITSQHCYKEYRANGPRCE